MLVALLILIQSLALVASGQASVLDQRAERQRLLVEVRSQGHSGLYIVIDTQTNRLQLRRGEDVLLEAVCATGSGRILKGKKRWHQWRFYTPQGRFSILRKEEDPLWIRPVWDFIENGEEIPIFAEDRRRFQRGVLGEYALYFAPDYMIHGTLFEVNLGKSITHGCVRLGADDLRYLYERVDVGCPVYIY
ncbi:MAG: L,D-transpeptidase [Candidatus Latescibacterota bacterium]